MSERTTEDRLREEYFNLLPEIRRVVAQVEAEIRYFTLPILNTLDRHEQLIVKTRIKECESAVNALRRRQEGGTFDPEKLEDYSLLKLADLAGVRILVFPRSRLDEVDQCLRVCFRDWKSDPVLDIDETVLARKYNGYCQNVSDKIRAEYQIVPMLIGLFWDVEHSAMYKPPPSLKGKVDSEPMKALRRDVENILLRFEEEFESLVRENP